MSDGAGASIVTTTRDNFADRGGTLPLLRAALSNQRLPPESEWVLVDDGSSDRTGEFLAAIDGETVGDGLEVTVRRGSYGSRAAGRNAGVEAAAADRVLFLDADTLPLGEHCVETALDAAGAGRFACGARRYWSPPEWGPEAVRERLAASRPVEAVAEWAHLPEGSMSRARGRRTLQEYSLVGNFGVVPVAALRRVGGFDEAFDAWGYEAEDLTARLLLAGLDLTNLHDAAAVLHLNHPLDVPGGAAESNRERYESKLAARGVSLDLPGLLAAPAGEHDEHLRVDGPGGGVGPVSVARPRRLAPPGDAAGAEPPTAAPVRRRDAPDREVPLAGAERDDRRISVVVSTADCFRDRQGSIELLLEAFENQRTGEFEAVVVDDGSTDETGPFLREYAAETSLEVTVLRFEDNSGNRSKARNRGAEAADGDLLLFVDDDTVPLSSDAIERLRRLYTPGTFLCGAKRRWTDTDWDRAAFRRAISAEAYERLRDASWVPRGISRRRGHRSLWEVTHLTNFGLVSRRDFLDVGGFDAETFAQWGREDIDLMLRLYLNGVGFLNLYDFVSVLHLNHPLKPSDLASREEAFYDYKRKEREEYGFEFDLDRLYGIDDGGDGEGTRVLRPVGE